MQDADGVRPGVSYFSFSELCSCGASSAFCRGLTQCDDPGAKRSLDPSPVSTFFFHSCVVEAKFCLGRLLARLGGHHGCPRGGEQDQALLPVP